MAKEQSAIKRAADIGISLMSLRTYVRRNWSKTLSKMNGDYEQKLRDLGFKKTVQKITSGVNIETPSGWSLRAVADFEGLMSADDQITEIVYQWTPATKNRAAMIEAFYK